MTMVSVPEWTAPMDTDSRVRRGMRYLDAVAEDWADRIDLDTLDLVIYTACVIGQVFRTDWSSADANGPRTAFYRRCAEIEAHSHSFEEWETVCRVFAWQSERGLWGAPREMLAKAWAVVYGFHDAGPLPNDLDALTAAWRAAIQARRTAG